MPDPIYVGGSCTIPGSSNVASAVVIDDWVVRVSFTSALSSNYGVTATLIHDFVGGHEINVVGTNPTYIDVDTGDPHDFSFTIIENR